MVETVLAIGSRAVGIVVLPVDLGAAGYLAIVSIVATRTAFALAKTFHDEHEASQFIDKIEDAASERVMRDAARGRI